MKVPNKGVPAPAEGLEKRAVTVENPCEKLADRTQSRKPVSRGLAGVREAAEKDRSLRLNNLLHHITPALLRTSYEELKRNAAPGIDGQSWEEYGGCEEQLVDLADRIHRGTYRAKPSKRIYIEKADGKQRPIGIASVEDKIVQQAVVIILRQIYEADFKGFSYGYRPGKSQHDALDALSVALLDHKVNWIVDLDIRSFFDSLDHGWLMKFLEHRISDPRLLRLIGKWLRAGVSEEGQWSPTKVGTPQGSVISPLLANVYLHYALDLWADKWRKDQARGEVYIVRYADDVVVGFQHEWEAKRFLKELKERLAQFNLEVHSEKTRVIEFGRFAARDRKKRGADKPETFDFLGFTHICTIRRTDKKFSVKRLPIAKKLSAKIQEITETLKRRMHDPPARTGRYLRSVLRGLYNFYAVPGTSYVMSALRKTIARIWVKVLRRRSQRAKRKTWTELSKLLDTWLPSPRIIHPYPNQRFYAKHPR